MIDPTGHSMQSLRKEIEKLTRFVNNGKKQTQTFKNQMGRYLKQGDMKMYDIAYNSYVSSAVMTAGYATQLAFANKEYAQFKILQDHIDKKEYHQIYQQDYTNIPFYGTTVKESGCGYIAAVIAESSMGGKVDVHDTYLALTQPGANFPGTDAVGSWAVNGYLQSKGYQPHAGDTAADMLPNTTYITYYGTSGSFHYVCFTTDKLGQITPSNHFALGDNQKSSEMPVYTYINWEDFSNKAGVGFVPGLTYYTRY